MMKNSIKLLISLLFFIYLFQKISWTTVWEQLQDANVSYLLLYIFLGLIGVFVSSIRWHSLLTPQGIRTPVSQLFILNLVGMFFNNVLPTSVGGDVVKAYELGRVSGKKMEAYASVFVDRFIGLTSLITLVLVGNGLEPTFLNQPPILLSLGFVIFGYLVVVFFIFKGYRIEKLKQIQKAILLYRNKKKTLLIALGFSFLFNLVNILNVQVGCLIFGSHISLPSLLVAVPLILLLFMIPISIGGIGLHEWAYFFVLPLVGVPVAASLSFALIYRARSIGLGLIGGAFYPFFQRQSA